MGQKSQEAVANAVDVNATDRSGNTAMKYAEINGFKDVEEMLIRYGAKM